MNTPDPAAIEQVADRLEACLRNHPDPRLDMNASTLRFKAPNTLTGCLAAWWFVAEHPEESRRLTVSDRVADPARPAHPLYYHACAERLARRLGMDDARELTRWAKAHTSVWGNLDGHLLFQNMAAYAEGPHARTPPMRFDVILNHLRGVAGRIRLAAREARLEEAAAAGA